MGKYWPKAYQKQQRQLAEENSWEKKVGAISEVIPKLCEYLTPVKFFDSIT